jgi:dolichol-phosphate mannosyltransferase
MQTPSIELSVIVPTFNERDNVRELVGRLARCLSPQGWEVIFVDDDSPDGTADAVRDLAWEDARVRCLQRIDRRGLATACIEGMLASSAPFVAVMDADLQHDETLLPRMLDVLKQEDLDIVVGSRYAAGGGSVGLDPARLRASRLATRLSRGLVPAELSDPMSGFFMLPRRTVDSVVRRLSGIGFKILLDIFASAPKPLRFKELPYEFRTRHAGVSKLDSQALWDYAMLLADKLFGRFIPVRFVSFILVGGIGVVVHMAVLTILLNNLKLAFVTSQAAATLVAMTSNFALNNVITYRDMRLKGWAWVRGWVSFTVACSIGAVANVGVAQYLFQMDTTWFMAGLAGILVGAVWNYVITLVYTWKGSRRY